MPLNLFRRASKPIKPEDGIRRMHETLQMLDKREAYLNNKIQHEVAEAKRFMGLHNKRGAIICLKKKKMYEAQIEKISSASMTLHVQLSAIEDATITGTVIDNMRLGADLLAQQTRHLTADDVDRVMDDIQDSLDTHEQISNALGQSFGMTFDEDELDAELDALEEEALNAELSAVKPTGKTAVRTSAQQLDEEAELRALELSMA